MKNKRLFIIIACIVLVVGVVFVTIRMRSRAPSSGPGSVGEPVAGLSGADLKEWEAYVASDAETGIDLIDRALEEKKIKPEMAALYLAYAIFDDDRLPAEYKSDAPISGINNRLLEIRRDFDSYPKDIQDQIAPFLKRPDDPESYVNARYASLLPEEKPTSGLFIKTAQAARPSQNVYTNFLISADDRVKIWYPNVNTTIPKPGGTGTITVDVTTTKKMAEQIKAALDEDKILRQYDDLMKKTLMSDGTKGGDGRLDIYVAPAGTSLGICFPEGWGATPSYILINFRIGANRPVVLQTTLAHEIFHSYQYVYNYDAVRDNWYGEATAVWSEDFIYPEANLEHGRLKGFLHYPEVTVSVEKPPHLHHYSAYIFPYFLTAKFSDDFMRQSWEACDNRKPCIEGIDKLVDGGLKKWWKEFTLWNYNRAPAQYYLDWGPFPDISSSDGSKVMTDFYSGETSPVDIDALKPLSADLSIVQNVAEDEKIKRVDFSNLKQFTGKSSRASIKAVIYYKNGKFAVEDWTEKPSRSFCFENKDERFDKVVLIFSNSDLKKEIAKSSIKVEEKKSCYRISQADQRKAALQLPYMDSGAYKITHFTGTANVDSLGDAVEQAKEGKQYAYQTTWKVLHEYELVRDDVVFECGGSSLEIPPGWTTRNAGYLTFDLDPETFNGDGTFSVDLEYGVPHPRGNVENVPAVNVNCAGVVSAAGSMDVSGYKGTMKGVYHGKMTNMTESGADIEIMNSCMYGTCTMTTGAPFQTMDPIILRITKTES